MEPFSILIFLCALSMGSFTSHAQIYGTTFDVTKYGALGNGKTDDSKAFLAAWKAACGQGGEAKLVIPGGKTFLLSPTSFQGPCKSHSIIIQFSGEIVAPKNKSAYKGKDKESWIAFRDVNGLVVRGNGLGRINGRGSAWWNSAKDDSGRPTALRFANCQKLVVTGLTHVDSQKNHISITKCNGATISNLNIQAPPKSPNTDGIDISGSTNLQIHNLRISTGDDCIAINGGCSKINISKVACGTGHGISIGSLGKDGKHDEVEDIHISDCSFSQTDNGVRIKTWQGGSGFAKRISFTGITFNAADNPIIIDQYYCPHKKCKNQTSAVEVSDISYSRIHGTSIKTDAISFNCSKTVPCTKILLEDINITCAKRNTPVRAYCINAHGVARSVSSELKCLTN